MNIKLIQDHDDKCYMLPKLAAGEVTHPWWIDTEREHFDILWRDKDGNRHGKSVPWGRMWCEDVHCPGQVLVRLDWLLGRVQEELQASRVEV
jgi:hypothetical protein